MTSFKQKHKLLYIVTLLALTVGIFVVIGYATREKKPGPTVPPNILHIMGEDQPKL